VGKFPAGKGQNYEKYVMLTLRTMYEAEVTTFSARELASWGGLQVTNSMRNVLAQLVKWGWLSIEPQELRDGHRATIFNLSSCVWFGSQARKK